jgi:hypothetical protein
MSRRAAFGFKPAQEKPWVGKIAGFADPAESVRVSRAYDSAIKVPRCFSKTYPHHLTVDTVKIEFQDIPKINQCLCGYSHAARENKRACDGSHNVVNA